MSELDKNVIRIGLLLIGLLVFLILEFIAPYKESSVSKFKRWMNNIGLGVINTALIQFVIFSLAFSTAAYVTQNNIGLLNIFQVPRFLIIIESIVLMDFIMYLWHVLLHRLPVLWRFHRVHHTDLDVDVSSTLRYHVGEVILAGVVKIGAVYFLGLDVMGYFIFECVFLLADLFRHSRLGMPEFFDYIFSFLFVPPSLHRVHHSVSLKERHTNFGTIFSIWDRFSGTLLTGVNQKQIWTGVDGHIQEKKLQFHHLLYMPFTSYVE